MSSRDEKKCLGSNCFARSSLRIVLTALVAIIWLQIPATKALGYQVCERKCGFGDAACAAAIAACDTKINAYFLYMDQMGAGGTKYQLPDVYRDILRARYPQTNFNTYRFGFADRQPPNNATTDCNTTYFNNADYVERLRKASANPNWFWLLHEVAHPEQCTAAGGREGYAKRWWDELEAALAAQGIKVNVLQPPQALADQIGKLFFQVHDMMPMEQQANKKANAVLTVISACCRSQGDAPIRPLELTAIEDRTDGGSLRRILKAKVANGDAPFTTRWWIKSPGDRNPVEQPQNLIKGLELLWSPNNNPQYAEVVTSAIDQRRTWRHEIQVEVTQQSKFLEKKSATRAISFSERVFSNLPKTGPQFDKLPAELPPSKLPEALPTPTPSKPGPGPGPLPTKPPVGP
jgi:hypothetical protein